MDDNKNIARVKGQNRFPCNIVGCPHNGRRFLRLGPIDVNYCARHRKPGERIVNFLVDSVLRFKLTNLLADVKHDLFKRNHPEFCEGCNKKLADYVQNMIIKLDELKKYEEMLNAPSPELEDFPPIDESLD